MATVLHDHVCTICGRHFKSRMRVRVTCGRKSCTKAIAHKRIAGEFEKRGSKRRPCAEYEPKQYATRAQFAKIKADIFKQIDDDAPLKEVLHG